MSNIQVKIEKQGDIDMLTVSIPISKQPSKSGKTMLVASTHGALPTVAQVDGKPVTVSLNAYIK